MPKTQYEQQKNAIKRYLEKMDKYQIRMPAGCKSVIENYASAAGLSMNKYIESAILEKMGLQEWPKIEESETETERE